MKILAIESSAAPASAALWEDGLIKGEYSVNTRKVHSQTLMPMVENLLKNTGTSVGEIDLFAVSSGPGSFTGIRIGVAAVKGMALGLGRPCAAVSTLEAIALGASGFDGVICAVMDARRNQFYNALFDFSPAGYQRLTEDRAVSSSQLGEELLKFEKNILLVGDGAELCYNNLKDLRRLLLAPEHIRYQRAACVAMLGNRAHLENATVSAEDLLPVYLRLPQAERELKKRLQEKNG